MSTARALDPTRADDVARAIEDFVSASLDAQPVRFAEAPQQITHGWDTYLYTFRLEGDGLDQAWTAPLVIRIFADPQRLEQARQEAAVQRFVAERGFPAPRPLAVDDGADTFGLPFVVMERAPGRPMLDRVFPNLFAAPRLIARMADAHVELHRIDPAGFPVARDGPFVEQGLMRLRTEAERFGMSDAGPGIAWLEEHKEMVIAEVPVVCHGDFHPLNIVVADDGSPAVVDWTSAMLADRHVDIASTLTLITLAPMGGLKRTSRLIASFARGMAARRYLAEYRRLMPVDDVRLRYWQALVVMGWWVELYGMQTVGSAALGMKSGTEQRVAASDVQAMRRRFEQLTGTNAR